MVVVTADLRKKFMGVRDQSSRPTCLAFAVSDTHAAMRSDKQALSCEYVYYHAVTASHGDPHRGVDFPSILEVVRTKGQPSEAHWPYLGKVPSDLSRWKPPSGLTPLYRRESVSHTKGIDDIWDHINRDTPVVIGMTISDAFYKPDKYGVISSNEQTNPALRHAVIGLGHGVMGQERLLLIRNSWGNAWGLNGHAWITEDYLDPRLVAYAELTTDLTV